MRNRMKIGAIIFLLLLVIAAFTFYESYSLINLIDRRSAPASTSMSATVTYGAEQFFIQLTAVAATETARP